MIQTSMIDWHFPRDELADAYLRNFKVGITNSTTLFAERRRGKTEFLLRDVLPTAEKAGYRVCYCSMWAARQDPALVLCSALRDAVKANSLSERVSDLFKSTVKSIDLETEFFALLKANAKIEFDDTKAIQPTTLLVIPELLDALIERAKPNKVLLLLDEIQFLAKPVYEDFVAALRTALDVRRDRVNVIYTGSSRVRLQKMFDSIKAPLFQSSQTSHFPDLGIEFVEFMAAQFKEASQRELDISVAMEGFEYLNRSPGPYRDALRETILNNEPDFLAVCKKVAADNELKAGFDEIWGSLKEIDRSILSLILNKEPLYTEESCKKIATDTGIKGTMSVPQVQWRVRWLVEQQFIINKGRGKYEIEDSAFKAWLQRLKDGDMK